ncbi:MAG: cupredoxin domain-containing protein [Nitrososphaeraceae archaeon]
MLNNIIAIIVISFIIVGSLWGIGNLLNSEEIPDTQINSGILLIAQNNLFNNSNPTISANSEIPTKLTIVNKDFVKHDFIVDELNINTAYMSAGQDFVTAIASNEPGIFEYYCSLHPSTMRGEIIIN